MFKRLIWALVGAGFGFGMAFWVTRLVKETMARYAPEKVSGDLAGAIRDFGKDLRAAVSEGAEAMREREEEIRVALDNGNGRRPGRLRNIPPTEPTTHPFGNIVS